MSCSYAGGPFCYGEVGHSFGGGDGHEGGGSFYLRMLELDVLSENNMRLSRGHAPAGSVTRSATGNYGFPFACTRAISSSVSEKRVRSSSYRFRATSSREWFPAGRAGPRG